MESQERAVGTQQVPYRRAIVPTPPGDVAVTVIMPVYNEDKRIEGALLSVLSNCLPGGFEVLVVDGMSHDRTRDIVARIARSEPRLRLLDNPERTVPHAMNLGIRAARGNVIVRVDGHAEVTADFLMCCVEELDAHPECGCVGGAIEYVPEGRHADAISMAMASTFGVGNAAFRLGGREGYVDTLAFGAYRKASLEAIGLFDEDLVRNQDDELNFRLRRAGQRIWLSSRIRSRYYARSTYPALYRQFYQYGYWKVLVNRKHGVVTTFRQLIPPAFLVGLGALAVASFVAPTSAWLLAVVAVVYLVCAIGFALRKSGDLRRVPHVVLAFAALHFGYGLGYMEGILHFHLLGREPRVRHSRITR